MDAAGGVGEGLVDLVGGEAEDGRGEAGEGVGDFVDGGLGAAAGEVQFALVIVAGLELDGVGVEAVFEDVEVEGAEFGVTELVEQVVDAVEFEVGVGLGDFAGEFGGAGEDVLVDRLHRIQMQLNRSRGRRRGFRR